MAKIDMQNSEIDLQCSNSKRPYVVGWNDETHEAIVFRPRCNNWTCEACAEENSRIWQLHAFRGTSVLQAEGYQVDFITLTVRSGGVRTLERSIATFRKAWPKLSRRAKYHNPAWYYIFIPEQHDDGTMHAHMIATNVKSEHWWHDNAHASGLGFEAKVKTIENASGAAWYVSKYTGKDFVIDIWPKNFRRIRCSRNWPKLELDNLPDEWKYKAFLDKGKAWWEMHMLHDLGYEVAVKDSALT